MMRNVEKTELICLFCRKPFAELLDTFIFPRVYDFCGSCELRALRDFERQMKIHLRLDEEDGS